MGGEFEIRRYGDSDAKRVWSVHELALRASPLEFVDDALADADLTAILEAGGEFLVGLVGDTLVAVGGVQPHTDETAKLRRMRVHPDHQRRGYGGRLLGKLETYIREREFDQIVVETNERLTAAQEFYAKHRYEEKHRETNPAIGDEFIFYRKSV